MIEKLEGTRETIRFEDGIILKLHDNNEAEDYPMHWHLPIEIIMPVRNEYGIRCGKTLYQLRHEDILLVQPGVLHECIAPEEGRRFFCQISLPAQLVSTKMSAAMTLLLPPAMLITPEINLDLHHRIRDFLYQTYQVDSNASLLSDFTKYLYVLQIIHLVYSFFEQNVGDRENRELYKMEIFSQLQRACTYVLESYAEEITLDAVAHMVGFSKYHFSRLFRSYTGETFHRYLNAVRMSNAQNMLTDLGTPITDIAYAVGYSSMSSFIRMFKDFYGCTPSHYRRMLDSK